LAPKYQGKPFFHLRTISNILPLFLRNFSIPKTNTFLILTFQSKVKFQKPSINFISLTYLKLLYPQKISSAPSPTWIILILLALVISDKKYKGKQTKSPFKLSLILPNSFKNFQKSFCSIFLSNLSAFSNSLTCLEYCISLYFSLSKYTDNVFTGFPSF
jgi:hypothetical protein